MCLQFCLLFGRCVECCLLCAVDVTKWNRGLKVNSAIWPSALCTLRVESDRDRERTRESCKRPSRMFAQFLLWIKKFTHKLHSLFYWTQVQSLPCQFVKIDKLISLLFYEFAIVVTWICLNCYMYMSNLFYIFFALCQAQV